MSRVLLMGLVTWFTRMNERKHLIFSFVHSSKSGNEAHKKNARHEHRDLLMRPERSETEAEGDTMILRDGLTIRRSVPMQGGSPSSPLPNSSPSLPSPKRGKNEPRDFNDLWGQTLPYFRRMYNYKHFVGENDNLCLSSWHVSFRKYSRFVSS